MPARFIDLPATHTLAWERDEEENEEDKEGGEGEAAAERYALDEDVRIDPLGVLADTAGYDDAERWWEDVVEHRGVGKGDALAPFTALEEAMTALRETYGSGGHGRDLIREAHMRLRIREAQREFEDGVAVVCGAWHVPALRRRAGVTADRALLKGLPRVKTDVTWVPWTHRRLSRAGGYGAGIDSPGWYAHLFAAPDRPVERWLTKVAGLLRAEDRAVSPGHVIEAVRLAETLAALRGRPLPGLGEATDAVRAVMCDGSDVPLALVHDRLVVGDVLGKVPDSVPAVPLQRDLERTQRRLRLGPEAAERELDLDLRRRPTRSAAGCCTGCGCSASTGDARPPRAPAPAPSGRPGGCAGSPSWPCAPPRRGCGDDRVGRRDRQGGRRTRSPRAPWPTSPVSLSAACWPPCPTPCRW